MISRPLALTFAGFAVLGAAVLGAFLYERLHPAPSQATPASAAVIAARPEAPPAEAETVPTERPLFALADLAGKPHSIGEWDGKALIVNFWATWCAPCRREMPLLSGIQREYGPKGVEVVGIAVDIAADVKTYLAKAPVDYPVLVGEQDAIDAAQAFGVNALAFPFTAFTDPKGRILMVHVGELHEATARAILRIALAPDTSRMSPAEARAAVRAALAALPPEEPAHAG